MTPGKSIPSCIRPSTNPSRVPIALRLLENTILQIKPFLRVFPRGSAPGPHLYIGNVLTLLASFLETPSVEILNRISNRIAR